MRRGWGMSLIAGGLIFAFLGIMSVSFMEIRSIDRSLQSNTGENLLWLMSRTNYEAQRLALAMERGPQAGAPSLMGEDEFEFRRDMLLSRLRVVLDQPQAALFAEFGMSEPFALFRKLADGVIGDLQALSAADIGARAQLERFRPQLDALTTITSELANKVMIAERDKVGRHYDAQTAATERLVVASLALFLLGFAMSGQLLRLLRQKQRVAQELEAHRANLETIVAERTQALHEALETERHAKDVYRSFISTVSHQFRTPLAVISMLSQRLTRRAWQFTPDQVAEKSARITAAATRLLDLLSSVTNAAAVDQSHIVLRRQQVALRSVVESALDALDATHSHRRFRLLPPPAMALCDCDPVLIEQIVQNLLGNAAKYSAATDPIEIRLWQEGMQLFCAVRDQGIGIPQQDQPRIFERFHRASNAANIFGSGLGLNLSRDIASFHGGTLTFTSQEGEGSIFTLSLPAVGPVLCDTTASAQITSPIPVQALKGLET